MRTHEGSNREKGMGCFSCGRASQFIKDCPLGSSPVCFHCNQVGYMKVDYPTLTSGVVMAPALATLRIINGREGRAEALVVRS